MNTLFPDNVDLSKLSEFARFSVCKHGNQQYGSVSYAFHLQHVVAVLVEYGADEDIQNAGWGHDLMEDTPVSRAEIEAISNRKVADLCWAVKGEGDNRVERLDSVIKKIPLVPGSELLKMADRYCNVFKSVEDRNFKLMSMYVGEHSKISQVFPTDHQLRRDLDALIDDAKTILLQKNARTPETGRAPRA